jgi:hypothetical protein
MKQIEFDWEINIAHLATVGAVFAYVSGYLIHSLYARSIGIQYLPFVKASYIEVGLVFLILSVLLVALPLALWHVISGTKQHLQFSPTGSKRSLVVAVNFCFVLMLFSLFITKNEWEAVALNTTVCNLSFYTVFHGFLWITLLGLIAAGEIQKLELSIKRHQLWALITPHARLESIIGHAFALTIAALRWVLVALAIGFDCILLSQMSWIATLLTQMRYFVPMLILVAYVSYRVKCKLKELSGNAKLQTRLAAIYLIVLVPLLYTSIISYTYGPYRLLPDNRGGRLPLRCARMYLADDARSRCVHLIDASETNTLVTVPLRICDETDEMYYVTQWPLDPLTNEPVTAISRSLVLVTESYRSDRSFRITPQANKGVVLTGNPLRGSPAAHP